MHILLFIIGIIALFFIKLYTSIKYGRSNYQYERQKGYNDAFINCATDEYLERDLEWQYNKKYLEQKAVVNEFMKDVPEWKNTYLMSGSTSPYLMIEMAKHGKVPSLTTMHFRLYCSDTDGKGKLITIEPHLEETIREKFAEKYEKTLRENGLITTILFRYDDYSGRVHKNTFKSLKEVIDQHGYGSDFGYVDFAFAETTSAYRDY